MNKTVFTVSPVSNLLFYHETLRIIRFYINSSSYSTPIEILSNFHQEMQKQDSQPLIEHQEDSTILNEIEVHEEGSVILQEKTFNAKRIVLIEELRILVLSVMPSVKNLSKKVLQRYHLYLHMLELQLHKDKTKYEKLFELLEANFKIDEEDLIRNACRGNYGRVIEIEPELEPAIEAWHQINKDNVQKVREWKQKYGIPDNLFRVLTGKHTDFENVIEEYCYSLLHGITFKKRSELLDIIDGRTAKLEKEPDSWLRLVYFLIFGCKDIREYEECFEQLFFQLFKTDSITALDYLSYSRKCVFYFPYIVDLIDLNPPIVESLIRFCESTRLEVELVTSKYSVYLQKNKEYEQLARFILNHKIQEFTYDKAFMDYFIANYDRFRQFKHNEKHTTDSLLFIKLMSGLPTLCDEEVTVLLKSEYFVWYIDTITEEMIKRNDLSDATVLLTMNVLVEIENRTGISLKHIKVEFAKKLMW